MDLEKGETATSGSATPVSQAGTVLSSPPKKFTRKWLARHLRDEISAKHADLLLLVCALISGLLDGVMFNAYRTFVSMQTGNTIFLGLGASGQGQQSLPNGWARSMLSIIAFMLGCYAFSRYGLLLGNLHRGMMASAFLVQSIFIFVAASLIHGGLISGETPIELENASWDDLAPIMLLSFQSAGQIVASRQLKYDEIPTVVVTSMIADLWIDPDLAQKRNAKRNRRAASFALTLIGAIIGGWISATTHSIRLALWLVGAMKVVLLVAWLFWAEEKEAF